MKISSIVLFAVLISVAQGSCNKHLINNKEYRNQIDNSFIERKKLARNRSDVLFSVFNKKLSVKETEALRFLFAFMPLSDLADYSGDFFLSNVDMSLRAKKETIWGKDIPEDLFLHNVLPVRINNENLDSFRIVYYDEIIERIKGKNLKDAALEINHWCHEKVNYQPSDIRTSAPMSTILSARGRCGEESTFTVAALRTAGIPARQVYTPRWAQTDDNHAWVEIWDNGAWYYMGACEPEPVLDRGWFTEPARRAMLIHTKSFGASPGNENTMISSRNFSEVNNLSKYAVTKRIFVKVLDKNGIPLNNAIVEYQLYNYAEFYPLVKVPTDKYGISQFETGLGDLLIWAHKDDDFDFKKISVGETDTLTLKLNRKSLDNNSIDLDLNVPTIPSPLAGPSKELIDQNSKRINEENIIRQKYIDSWMSSGEAISIALKRNIDTTKVMNIFSRSMGNYKEIRSFLQNTPDSLIRMAVSMLEVLADKDLRDIKKEVLNDHLNNLGLNRNISGEPRNQIFFEYILNPRIANEKVVAWRGYFKEKLPVSMVNKAHNDPSAIVEYINENIKIADDENYYKTPLTPRGVFELKVSDVDSRAIFFVAICRSLNIPSRLEPGSNVPQYFFNNSWNDVYFADQKHPVEKRGYLLMKSDESNPIPEYYMHFTIARFENGRYNTLEYDFNKKITEFSEELPLAAGNYMLVTGNRLNNSNILSKISFFNLAEGEHKTIKVELRKEMRESKILGKINTKEITGLLKKNNVLQPHISESGVVIVWIAPDMEPTKHLLNDMYLIKNELDLWGGSLLFLTTGVQDSDLLKNEEIKRLPVNSFFGTDINFAQLRNISSKNIQPDIDLPYVIIADRSNNILYKSSGYSIGIGEQILKHIK
jgi:transglutaminase-like putative cysteine protease